MSNNSHIIKINHHNLFCRNKNQISAELNELSVQTKAQEFLRMMLRACHDAGGMTGTKLESFGMTTLSEYAIIAARNNVNISAKYLGPEPT